MSAEPASFSAVQSSLEATAADFSFSVSVAGFGDAVLNNLVLY